MPQPSDNEIEVFNVALELPRGERAAYLERVCAGDAALRQRVEELLKASEESCDYLEGPDDVAIELGRKGRFSRVLTEKAGDRIGRYKLLQQIGEGGCGVVYMAEQEEPVHRRVALKVIKLGMDTKSVVARFEAERQALALMDHPNIAKVLDAGATETGRPYFVMELVKAVPITRYCDENNLGTVTRLGLFVQVCQAVQHAHQKGIIHRDIKPSNILVADHDGVPVPKIIDFGIAKATTDQRLTDKTVFTALEQFIGTPAYMSPEQAKLSGLDVDTRSDIYSLGVLLYELLTGRTPFEAKRLMEAGLDEIRRIIREEEPVTPSTKLQTLEAAEQTTIAKLRQTDPPKLVHLIRGDLDWIVMKALEKQRERRYETANGLAMDIQRHLGNEPVLARPPSAVYRLQKAWQRHKTAFAIAWLIAVVLVAATGVSAWQAFRASQAGTLAKERLAESEAISKFLTEVFLSPDPSRDGRTITVAQTLSNAMQKLETDLTNQPARRAKLQGTLGWTYHEMGLESEAILLQIKVRDYFLAAFGPEHPDTVVAMNNLAISYRHAGRLNEALKLQEQVLALRRKVNGPEHLDTIGAMANLANSYDDAGRRDEALKLNEQVLALRRKVNGPEHPDTIAAMQNLSNIYWELGRQREALEMREQVLALRRKVNGPEHPAMIAAMQNLALSYHEVGRREEALELMEQAVVLHRKVNGPDHPQTLRAMNSLATFYGEAGRREEALKMKEKVLELRRKVSGPEHLETLMAMYNLANAYADAGRGEEALELREQVLALFRKVSGPEHPFTLEAMLGLAGSFTDAGRHNEAIKLDEEALVLCHKVLPPEHPQTLRAMDELANSYYAAGRLDEALKLREESLSLFRKVRGPDHPDTLKAMGNLANSYFDAGRRDEALSLREEVLALRRKLNGPEHPDTIAAMIGLANSYNDSSRREEGLKLMEKALPLSRKLLGPEHPTTLLAMDNMANSYYKAGRWDEARQLLETALPLSRKLNGPTNSGTLWIMNTLADSYAAAGQNKEAAVLLENLCKAKPNDTEASQTLAIWQAWINQQADYEASSRRLVQQAEGTDQATTANRAGKVACLRPTADAALLTKALSLAQRAVELGKKDPLLPWFQLGLGIAEYRTGEYAAAERSLSAAEQTAGDQQEIVGSARLFRAMSLYQQNEPVEARKLLSQAEALMAPPPKDGGNPPVYAKPSDRDLLVMWMAYKETKALLESSSAPIAEPSTPK